MDRSFEEKARGVKTMPIELATQKVYAAADATLAIIGSQGDASLREHFASRYMMLLAEKYAIVPSAPVGAKEPVYA